MRCPYEDGEHTANGKVATVTADLISRARAGDGEAFRALTEPHRHELHVHCYRMLGSLQDAEDAVQDTLLSAWQGLDGFAERASMRTWLYRIATNRCLNALRMATRRPAKEWNVPGMDPPEPTRLGEVTWLEPYPDAIFDAAAAVPLGPEARYEQSESISLAFVTALQVLPRRQLAALVLKDVLGFPASEVADMLDTTTESVTSALKRARASLAQHSREADDPPPAPRSSVENELVARFVAAYEAADVPGVVDLLTDDVLMAMPPIPLEYIGPALTAEFLAMLFDGGRRYRLIPTRANGHPAFGSYVPGPDGVPMASGLFVASIAGDRISGLVRFEPSVLPWFGLPDTLALS